MGQSPEGDGTSPISIPQQASADVAKEYEHVVRPSAPISKGDEAPELHVRYNLTARHTGKLFVRVRAPRLATDPNERDYGVKNLTLAGDLIAMGEFGRTLRMNANVDRDHWDNTFSVLFGSGGMNMGQTIGRSSTRGEHVIDRPFDPQDAAAAIYHHLGIDPHAVSFPDHAGRPLALLDHGRPIRELIE